jgi:hypothetical protein
MAGAPEGNQNSTRDKRLMNATLKRELTQRPEDALAIVRNMIEAAKKGEAWAVKEVFDRESGKPKQPLVGGDDEGDAPIQHHHTVEFVNGANTASDEA